MPSNKCPRCGDIIRSAGGCPCADIGSAEFLRRVNAPTVKDYVERVMREAADAERKRVAALEEENKRLKAALLAECAKATRYGELVDWMASEEANSCTVYDPACGEYVTPLMAYGQERARRAFKESSDAK